MHAPPLADAPRRLAPSLAVLLAMLLQLGCAGPPPRATDAVPVSPPDAFTATGEPGEPAESVLAAAAWLDSLGPPALRALVDEALRENRNLNATRARLASATAQARIDGAARWPSLEAGLTAARTQRNSTGGLAVISSTSNNFDLSLDTRWEVDVWGRLRNATRAAVADAQAAEADLRAGELSLTAAVASAWFNALTARDQLALAEQTVTSFEASLGIIESRFRRGLVGALDLRLARTDLAAARAAVSSREAALDARLRAFEVLLGRYPAANVTQPETGFPDLAPIPTGLPSELLLRRPDLRAAERRLAAATQRLRAAGKARFLPSFVLTASGGRASPTFDELLDPEFLVWQIAAGITQPLFQAGRLAAQVERTRAQLDEAVASYGQTALEAFEEVETALLAERTLAEEVAARDVAVREAVAALELARADYQRGLTDVITLLSSQRRAFDARQALLDSRNTRIQNRIDLHLALGGGFKSVPGAMLTMDTDARDVTN